MAQLESYMRLGRIITVIFYIERQRNPTLVKKLIKITTNTSHAAYHHHLTLNTHYLSSSIHHHLTLNTYHPTISLVLSTHKPQRRQGRDDGGLAQSHRLKRPYATDGWGGEGNDVGLLSACRRTHNQGNPSGRYGTMPSDKTCRKMRYGQQVASLLSSVRSVPTPH